MRQLFNGLLLSCFLTTVLMACQSDQSKTADRFDIGAWHPLSYTDLGGWEEDDHASALKTLQMSCANIIKRRDNSRLGANFLAGSYKDLCRRALETENKNAQSFFEKNFQPAVHKKAGKALFTAYYEPIIDAALEQSINYPHAIYALPPELRAKNGKWGVLQNDKLQPYLTRSQIDAGALLGRDLELAWARDPVDLYFMHIQGSGRLSLDDQTEMRLGFAGKNGHPYRSVGKYAVETGLFERNRAGSASIRSLFAQDPQKGRTLLNYNPSYVFFRNLHLPAELGPIGAMGVALTPMRSLALDRRYTPLGIPVWVDMPSSTTPLRQLFIAQDTGGAIVGAGRADLFFGTGEHAGKSAGSIKYRGRMTSLLPRFLFTYTPHG